MFNPRFKNHWLVIGERHGHVQGVKVCRNAPLGGDLIGVIQEGYIGYI